MLKRILASIALGVFLAVAPFVEIRAVADGGCVGQSWGVT